MLLMSKASLCIRSRIIWKQRGYKILGPPSCKEIRIAIENAIAADTFISHCWDWKERVPNESMWKWTIVVPYRLMCSASSPVICLIQLLFPLSSWSCVKCWLWVWFLCWRKLHVRLVVTSHRKFFKCIQNKARGLLITAHFSCRKFLT